MTTTAAYGVTGKARLPEPLAEEAETARRHAGPCALCNLAIKPGHRFACLVPDGRRAHLACIARQAGTGAGRAA